ncbi:MAG: hypothetical protein K6E16_08025 [Lachnospiraceae bacterium]|nr:hypothetical protein [Lachnospiraceae bacterium]
MDTSGLSPEQQALFASIMGKSPQPGGGAAFTAAQAAPAPAAPAPAASDQTAAPAPSAPAPAASAAPAGGNSGRILSQAEIDALIASMGS